MADITSGYIWVDGEKGVTAAKMNSQFSGAVIQPAFVSAKPVTSTADPADNMLILKAAGTYAQVPVSTLTTSIGNALPSQDTEIWSVRLKSFNAAGNPTFEVDQRNASAILTNPATGVFLSDRWTYNKTGTMVINGGQNSGFVLLPGTNFTISRCFLRVTLTTQQASLGVNDVMHINQFVEGPYFRELINDVHSISLLVRSSVAGLKFGLSIGDAGVGTKSLTKLCTIPTANVWVLLQFPNLPVFPAGNFSTAPGLSNQYLRITLAAGANGTSPANDTWQSGVFSGAIGQSNFAASPTSSTFDMAFCQWEPGPVCSTPMDKSFTQNLDECLRYYEKTYDLSTAVGTVTSVGCCAVVAPANMGTQIPVKFKKMMAKAPTVTIYSPNSGAVNNIYNATGSADAAVAGIFAAGQTGFSGPTLTAVPSVSYQGRFHYTADTGW